MTEEEFLTLKKGDTVICNVENTSPYSGFHKGGIYILREDPTPDSSLVVEVDDLGSDSNGWVPKYFDAPDSTGSDELYKTLGMEAIDGR